MLIDLDKEDIDVVLFALGQLQMSVLVEGQWKDPRAVVARIGRLIEKIETEQVCHENGAQSQG